MRRMHDTLNPRETKRQTKQNKISLFRCQAIGFGIPEEMGQASPSVPRGFLDVPVSLLYRLSLLHTWCQTSFGNSPK